MRWNSLVAALLLHAALGPTPALAQTFADDLEAGDLGRWSGALAGPAANVARAAPEAAHRGGFGLRHEDLTGGPGVGAEGGVRAVLQPGAAAFARTWIRVAASNGQGSAVPLELRAASHSLLDVALAPSARTLHVGGYVGVPSTWESGSVPLGSLDDGAWHLLEIAVEGLGTAAGSQTIWIDGVQLLRATPLDWRDVRYTLDALAAGEPWTDAREFVGTFDLDDVRVTPAPPASRLTLRLPAQAAVPPDACVAADVVLRDSRGGEASAPYALDLSLTASGGTFHRAATCEDAPVQATALPPGASVAPLFLRATDVAVLSLSARHPDLLGADAQLAVDPGVDLDGGRIDVPAPEDPVGPPLAVSSDCAVSGAGDPAALLLAALVLAGRRRRR